MAVVKNMSYRRNFNFFFMFSIFLSSAFSPTEFNLCNLRKWVTYLRLSDMSGFHHESDMPAISDEMWFVKTDPYHFMLVGGETHGWSGRSTKNWLRWNHATQKVEGTNAEMKYTHDLAPAVAVPITKARIKSCAEPYVLPAP